MEALLIFLVFGAVVIYIAKPLFSSGQTESEMANLAFEALEAEKLSIYQQIKQADNEFELGLLIEEDYNSLRTSLKMEAARVLQKIKELPNR